MVDFKANIIGFLATPVRFISAVPCNHNKRFFLLYDMVNNTTVVLE
jgi:hypothetical protein